jgi:hypothetical protein
MKTLFLTATVALFLGQENVEAVKLNQSVRFIDDVVKMLAEAEEKDLAEEAPAQMSQCNPCYDSSWGPNPHYPYKGKKTLPNGATEGKTTDYKGPVTSDANVPGGKAGGDDKKAALMQADCNPCYTSNTGPNTHYAWKGNASAKPFGSTSPPAAGGDKKEEEKKAALSQIDSDCNPCPNSAAGPNPHYPAKPAAAGGDKKEEEKKAALMQADIDTDCNPCPNSAAGKNPHSPFDPNAKPAGGDKKEEEKKAALMQADCNPCYVSNAGPNTHYDYEGNKKAVPFGKTVAAGGDKKGDDKKGDAAKL